MSIVVGGGVGSLRSTYSLRSQQIAVTCDHFPCLVYQLLRLSGLVYKSGKQDYI